jgi:hypothetical protein
MWPIVLIIMGLFIFLKSWFRYLLLFITNLCLFMGW